MVGPLLHTALVARRSSTRASCMSVPACSAQNVPLPACRLSTLVLCRPPHVNPAHCGRAQGSVLVLVALGVLVCLCLPRMLASRNTARRRRADGKGGWIGLTQLSSGRQVAED